MPNVLVKAVFFFQPIAVFVRYKFGDDTSMHVYIFMYIYIYTGWHFLGCAEVDPRRLKRATAAMAELPSFFSVRPSQLQREEMGFQKWSQLGSVM